jgi:UDP-N-acetylmuramate: L-alanyl-gamma-D-glutamyl-meso-diaminopimelate ligase
LEFDHADIFADIAAIEHQFHHFLRILPGSGRIIVNGRDETLERVLTQGCWTPVERFGVEEGWQLGDVDTEGGFEVRLHGTPLGRVQWTQAGEHSRLNALAAIAAARHAGVEPRTAIEALARFKGVRRRLEQRGTARGVAVYDDFAHHPTAIRATLEGLRARVGAARILAVLEPRSNTMKLGVMKDRLAGSLAGADRVFVYTAGLGWDAPAALRPLGARASCHEELPALVAAIAAEARAGEHVLVMSNGGFGGIHDKLLAAIGARAAA